MTVLQLWRVTWISVANERVVDDIGAKGFDDAVRILRGHRGTFIAVAEVKRMGDVIVEVTP
jgi:hypothetical protein